MNSLNANIINELQKIFLKKRTVAYLVISIIIPVLAAVLFYFFRSRLGIFAVSAVSFPVMVLGWFTALLLPLFIFSTAADIFSGEVGEKTLKITLTRPISRFKVFASKNITIAAFTIIMLAVVFITSFISGLFLGGLDGGGQLPAGLSQWLPAYTAAIYPMLFLGILAAFVAQFFRSSGSALITCVFAYLAAKAIPLIFPGTARINPFAYTDWHVMWLGSSVTAGMLMNIFLLLLSYNLIFFAAGYYLFEKKEL